MSIRLDSQAAASRLAATNGADAKARLVLAAAALQLHDEHGNAAPAAGCKVRLSLQWQDGGQEGAFPACGLSRMTLAGFLASRLHMQEDKNHQALANTHHSISNIGLTM